MHIGLVVEGSQYVVLETGWWIEGILTVVGHTQLHWIERL